MVKRWEIYFTKRKRNVYNLWSPYGKLKREKTIKTEKLTKNKKAKVDVNINFFSLE